MSVKGDCLQRSEKIAAQGRARCQSETKGEWVASSNSASSWEMEYDWKLRYVWIENESDVYVKRHRLFKVKDRSDYAEERSSQPNLYDLARASNSLRDRRKLMPAFNLSRVSDFQGHISLSLCSTCLLRGCRTNPCILLPKGQIGFISQLYDSRLENNKIRAKPFIHSGTFSKVKTRLMLLGSADSPRRYNLRHLGDGGARLGSR
jgi:hypothetical protein